MKVKGSLTTAYRQFVRTWLDILGTELSDMLRECAEDDDMATVAARHDISLSTLQYSEEEIKGIESVLTVVDGKVVYAAGHFSPLAPPPIPVLPEWSPVVKVPGHYRFRSAGGG